MFVMPSTKHIASRIFDLPEPLRPVIELNWSSLVVVSRLYFANGGVNKPAGDDSADGIRFEALTVIS
jgi:hypothetical protein